MIKQKKHLILSLFLSVFVLSSCSHQVYYSSRDITAEEKEQLSFVSSHSHFAERDPADWRDRCANVFRNFFPKPKADGVAAAQAAKKPLPELTQLNPQVQKFPNGKQYTLYQANINVMNKYPDYDDFLEQTAEVIFEASEPFGHIRLRVGKKIYSFSNVQWTQINKFSPRMGAKSADIEKMPNSHGFVFDIGKEKIDAVRSEIDKLYETSQSHNVPPFDAYSPLLKIDQSNGLKYVTTSPKYGNSQSIKGKIIEENGSVYLEATNGLRVPVVKKGDEYFTQSYSCSTSAAHILEKFFGIKVSYSGGAKPLQHSLLNGNINENISPVAIIKYYEE